MEFYLDTAQFDEVRAAAAWGVLRGVTTNPSHMARAGVRESEMRRHVQELCWIADVPISVEVVALDAEGMVAQGLDFATWSPHVVVKLPTTPEGLKAMARLSRSEVSASCQGCAHLTDCPIRARFAQEQRLTRRPEINATLIFTVNQALLALAAGASYVSPFVGRLDAVGEDGVALVADLAQTLRVQQQPGKIIAAALRHPVHVTAVARAGAHIATMAYAILAQLIEHPLTTAGLEAFLQDYRRSQEEQ
ncbi:transaldolase family protein [Thermogemmatispora onikobensis]|uniref:transaldolase family protein n=1 Tax=Thermogemmatispora onikobensis TaxID=732234 RepID=UPI0008532661|nr:transaldolase family protein [Thermogemmatispora onikobensis]